jgi:hypothetical protein
MAYTFTTLFEDVVANMEEDSQEFFDALPGIIARAQTYLQKRVDSGNLIRFVQTSISASVRSLTLPADVLVLRNIQVCSPSGWQVLYQQTNEYLTVYWPDHTSVGSPKYYANPTNQILLLAPTPATNLTAELEYVANVTALSSTEPTNWFSEKADAAFFAAAMMYANMWTKNGEASVLWKARADEELTVLNNEFRRTRRSDAVDRSGGAPENTLSGQT